MHVLMVNWAGPIAGNPDGGGVKGYAESLSRSLLAKGHRVSWLSSGQTYRSDEPGKGVRAAPLGTCRIEARPAIDGIELWDVVNSPVLSMAVFQFKSIGPELSSPALERVLEVFFRERAFDVVHVHNIEGLSAGFVGFLRRGCERAAVVFSLHNYHTLCPQVNLMQRDTFPCHDFDQGHACRGCITRVPWPVQEMRSRVAPATRPGGTSSKAGGVLRDLRRVQGPLAETPAWNDAPEPWLTGYSDPTWRSVDNTVRDVPPNSRPLHLYGDRRAAFVRMLNSSDAVLAVSHAVGARFSAHGVKSLQVMTIGTAFADTPVRAERASSDLLRVCFLGTGQYIKGLPMLLDSLQLLSDDLQQRIELRVIAMKCSELLDTIDRAAARIGRVYVQAGYRPAELPQIVNDVDVGVVPSVWWDNGPQTVMEFLAFGVPVLGANMGGIPDFVSHESNGLLFRGNDRFDCARQIARLLREPGLLTRLRQSVTPPKSMSTHVVEMLALYDEVVARRQRQRSASPDALSAGHAP